MHFRSEALCERLEDLKERNPEYVTEIASANTAMTSVLSRLDKEIGMTQSLKEGHQPRKIDSMKPLAAAKPQASAPKQSRKFSSFQPRRTSLSGDRYNKSSYGSERHEEM